MEVVERALWAAVKVSYEKASEFLRRFTGLEVSRCHIHSLAMEEDRKLQAWEEEKVERVFERGLRLRDFLLLVLRLFIFRWMGQGPRIGRVGSGWSVR
ncbi:MAG: hypothetical protein N2513_04090 [Deltaproteobacteria bacterium]|nr:hypothetical protein [Deltaproteobacteria bacterium]